MSVVRLQVPAQAEYLDIVRVTLYGVASRLGFSYEDIEDMKVAVSEACNNAVLHAYPEGACGDMELTFEMAAASLTIRVKDFGQGAGPQAPAQPERRSAESAEPGEGVGIDELEAGGLGIYLMEALMDEVTVSAGDNGTEVTLVKHK